MHQEYMCTYLCNNPMKAVISVFYSRTAASNKQVRIGFKSKFKQVLPHKTLAELNLSACLTACIFILKLPWNLNCA